MLAQTRWAQGAGVDDRRDLAQLGQHQSLELDRLDQRMLDAAAAVGLTQWVRTPGFRKTPHQRVGVGVEEQGADGDAFGAQFVNQRHQHRQRASGPNIDRDCHPLGVARMGQVHVLAQQLRRQVVDAIKPGILKREQCH